MNPPVIHLHSTLGDIPVQLWPGVRHIDPSKIHPQGAKEPFGIIVIGYDRFDSYAYPGGLNMQLINPV